MKPELGICVRVRQQGRSLSPKPRFQNERSRNLIDDLAAGGADVWVIGGLAAGTRIVTAGINSLKQGQIVRIGQDAMP